MGIQIFKSKTITDLDYWEVLKQRIWDILDFDSSDYSDRFIKRRVESRMRFLNVLSYRDYAEMLISDRVEAKSLLKTLTVHVTHFFRDRSMYELLKVKIIPDLLETKKKLIKKPIIRIWSAGCSSGEEPLSTLIAILECLGSNIDTHFISILGTDRDNKIIKKAKDAIYDTDQFQETEEHYLEKYFEPYDDNHFRFKKKYMKYLTYDVGDITRKVVNNIDLLMCRNTVIYFHTEAKIKLYSRFYDFLNPGGFFIMGKTEVLLDPARKKFDTYDFKERVFRKPVKKENLG